MGQHHDGAHRHQTRLSVTEVAAMLRLPRRSVVLALIRRQLPVRRHGLRPVVLHHELLRCFGAPTHHTKD